MVFYRNLIGRAGVKKIKSMTICPQNINPNEKMKVSEINGLVPRGGQFEYAMDGDGKPIAPEAVSVEVDGKPTNLTYHTGYLVSAESVTAGKSGMLSETIAKAS